MDRLQNLRARAQMLAEARLFFAKRGAFEVDCPLASENASVDAHIDLFSLLAGRYLHSSPEYGMKRLLAEGIGDIYQISHVFRLGELGRLHNPEFTLVEWYRSLSYEELIHETADFIRLFIGNTPLRIITYRKAFQDYLHLDPFTVRVEELDLCLAAHKIDAKPHDFDDRLAILLSHLIEPKFQDLTALIDYPATQAALAKREGAVAKRFEIYYKGIELCNGYDELADPDEQYMRLQEQNSLRVALGKEAYPIDHRFLAALKSGLPNVCGVAAGFDRLLMLKLGASHIRDVLPFDWAHA